MLLKTTCSSLLRLFIHSLKISMFVTTWASFQYNQVSAYTELDFYRSRRFDAPSFGLGGISPHHLHRYFRRMVTTPYQPAASYAHPSAYVPPPHSPPPAVQLGPYGAKYQLPYSPLPHSSTPSVHRPPLESSLYPSGSAASLYAPFLASYRRLLKGSQSGISQSTQDLINKYTPPPKNFYYPKYVLKPYPVPTPYYPRGGPPTPPHGSDEEDMMDSEPEPYRYRPKSPLSKEVIKDERDEQPAAKETKPAPTSIQEVKEKPKYEKYFEIGGIGYENIMNALTSSLSNVKIGTDDGNVVSSNLTEDSNKNRKVVFKVGGNQTKKPSPFIQIGQSRVTFNQDNEGGVTITFAKSDR